MAGDSLDFLALQYTMISNSLVTKYLMTGQLVRRCRKQLCGSDTIFYNFGDFHYTGPVQTVLVDTSRLWSEPESVAVV